MTIPENPPHWLNWTTTATAKGFTTFIAIIALIAATALGVRQQVYIHCVATNQRADAIRTTAIAQATDVERQADLRLLNGPVPGGPSGEELRAQSAAAREHTDKVRADNPPESPGEC